jgi:glycosyltransferase involved in cell wall biosynthesis
MRALVITPTLPPRPGLDVNGVYQRHALFIGALASVAQRLRIVHLVPASVIGAWPDGAALDSAQSAHWGCPVSVALLPRRVRPQSFYTHYLAGIAAAAAQPQLYPFAGAAVGAALRAELAAAPDLVLAMSLPAMLALRAAGMQPRNLYFDVDDVPHLVRLRASLQPPLRPGQLLALAQLPALLAATGAAVRAARASFVCSPADRLALRRVGVAGAAVVPNATDLPAAAPPLPQAPTLLFLGACHHPPNVAAAERLARRILPLVRAELPAARLLLAGDGSDRLAFAALPGVSGLGFVPDLATLYATTRVVCAPITSGSGTRLKLLEAAAYARAMVATRIGAEGLAFVDGQHILLRDSDADIAAACVRLLREDALAHRLGEAARALVREQYQAAAIRDQLARRFAADFPA